MPFAGIEPGPPAQQARALSITPLPPGLSALDCVLCELKTPVVKVIKLFGRPRKKSISSIVKKVLYGKVNNKLQLSII